MNDDWSDIEIELIVADYFSMLIDEINGIPINKTQHRKALKVLLNGRSDGSIEFKHQNISAVLVILGAPFIKGYKPRYNFQRSKLITKVEEYLNSNLTIASTFNQFAENVVHKPMESIDFTTWIVEPPETNYVAEPLVKLRRASKINYLEREQYNRELGLKGEELVMDYERYKLISAGKEVLASKIEWVSKEQGDGLGFDILSKNLNGTDKYIEVKTTKLTRETPFFFTSNEFRFSIDKADQFYLYRVFDFNNDPKMFSLKGRYDQFCHVEPIQYKGCF